MSTERVITRRCAEEDLADLLPLMRAYCDFYEVAPADDGLLALSPGAARRPASARACSCSPATTRRRGRRLRDDLLDLVRRSRAARSAVMNDLFVRRGARGTGLADALIGACRERARVPARARSLADRPGQRARPGASTSATAAPRSEWIDYALGACADEGHQAAEPTARCRAASSAARRSRRPRRARTTSTWASSGCPPARARARITTRTARAPCYMLSGRLEVRWGDHLEESVEHRRGRHGLRAAARDARPREPLRRRGGRVRRRPRLADRGLRRGALGGG